MRTRTTLLLLAALVVTVVGVANLIMRPGDSSHTAVCGSGEEDDWAPDLYRVEGVWYMDCNRSSH